MRYRTASSIHLATGWGSTVSGPIETVNSGSALVSSDGIHWFKGEQPGQQHGYVGHQFTQREKLKGPPKSIEERPIGRNTSCPCGSGNKFSQCCLRLRD